MPPPPPRTTQGSSAGLTIFTIGAVVTVVALALPYYGVTFSGGTGFGGASVSVGPLHYWANLLALLLQIAAAIFVILNRTGGMPQKVALGMACGAADLALVAIAVRMFTIPNPVASFAPITDDSGFADSLDVGLRYGAYVYLVGAAVLSAGALVATLPGARRIASAPIGFPGSGGWPVAPSAAAPPVHPPAGEPPWNQPPPAGYAYPPGQPYSPYAVQPGTNGFAIASLVLGILWLEWLGSVLAIIFGFVARAQIKRTGQGGDGIAVAGLVLGFVGIAMFVVLVVAISQVHWSIV